jgi:hypothetical protein
VRADVRLEERADDLRDGVLNHSIQHGGDLHSTLPRFPNLLRHR